MVSYKIYHGDCLEMLQAIPSKSVQTCVTSPPYYGLRDYGHDCQIGNEESPEEYIAKMVSVFRAVGRVLRDDGTLWINIGDSYAGSGCGVGGVGSINEKSNHHQKIHGKKAIKNKKSQKPPNGLKRKDLIGIPWRVAFALQADGWYLRQDIIWSKPNPMPESVKDRCTKSHEYIFLLSKSPKYYYDKEAIEERASSTDASKRNRDISKLNNTPGRTAMGGLSTNHYTKRNKRSVWTVSTKPYKEAHFAAFPPELITPCILAGSPKGGVVLDPFAGSGTTLATAIDLGRQGIGIELNGDYIELANKRIQQSVILLSNKSGNFMLTASEKHASQIPLFGWQ